MNDTISDLQRLMDLDPLNYTKQDLDAVIDILRKQRQNFDMGIKPAAKAKKAPLEKVEKIDADDLGL